MVICPECNLGELSKYEEPEGGWAEYMRTHMAVDPNKKFKEYYCCMNVDCGKCFDLKFNKM